MNAPPISPEIIRKVVAYEPEIRRIQISAMTAKASKALDSATGLTESDPGWVWTLRLKGKCALDEKEIEHAFLKAAKGDDGALFKKATGALTTPLDDADIKKQINEVEWLLLEQWLAKKNCQFFRSLCYYNDKALAKLIDFMLKFNRGHHNDKSIRKVWERLGLQKGEILFRDIEIKTNPQTGLPCAVPVYKKKLIHRIV